MVRWILSLFPPRTAPRPSGERILQERYGTRDQAQCFYDKQVLDHLNEAMQTFLARQQLMFLATSDANGNCDNSFRAGPAGFVHVLDKRRLAWPEYRGNGVMASLGNIVENPRVGLLFVDFGADGVGLHVNGGATIAEDAALRAEHPDLPADAAPRRRATRWIVADVHEAYIHCSKFIPRLTPGGRGPRRGQPDYFVGPEATGLG
jgi:predicted pyridoxine 5'-phosphate oxidase superfamily flavin-nucleotide-binding protein